MPRRSELDSNPQFSLMAILALVALVAWYIALLRDMAFGSRVPLIVMYVVVGSLHTANILGVQRVGPVRLPKLSGLEWLAIWFICVALHALSLPAVSASSAGSKGPQAIHSDRWEPYGIGTPARGKPAGVSGGAARKRRFWPENLIHPPAQEILTLTSSEG